MNYEELVQNHAGQLIEKLVTQIFNGEPIEVRFEFEENEQWSLVTIHLYEEDKEISLRLHPADRYELYFGYYDDEDEFHEIVKDLSPEEVEMIPKGLRNALQKVLSDEQGLRLPGNFLSR
jgi:hypothetical protein